MRSKLRGMGIKGLSLVGCAVACATVTTGVNAEIVWNGHFNDRDFRNYHTASDPDMIAFHLVPEYGRPPQYGGQYSNHVGNGELLDLVSSPTRGSNYAARFVVKNSANGSEPTDCDTAIDCRTRRTLLQMTDTLYDYYNAMPEGAERWLSISFYIPENFDDSTGSGFGPVLWGSKPSRAKNPGAFGIAIEDGEWTFIHRYQSQEVFDLGWEGYGAQWWYAVTYSSNFPRKDAWAQGLVDFPDEAASKAALANLNKGGWTDFILHFRTDVSKSYNLSGYDFERDNKGFLDLYMRAGSGPWVHVVDIDPMKDLARDPSWLVSSPERVYDRGIGQVESKGYTSQMGLYMAKDRVWNSANNMVVYMDNHKIGDENTTFEEMTHDGSSLVTPSLSMKPKPKPPVVVLSD